MQRISHLIKDLHWNGIHLQLPRNWEVIFSGKNHLLLENDFHPILELRWNNATKESIPKQKKRIEKQMARELPGSIYEIETPQKFHQLPANFETFWYSRHEHGDASTAILSCKTCPTLVLLRFHEYHQDISVTLYQILSSLRCHPHGSTGQLQPWTIQDLHFTLPESYSLKNYTIGAGFTSLTFSEPGTTLHVCRLATAAERLKKHDMISILGLLLDTEPEISELEVLSTALIYSRKPSIPRQIFMRIKRRKPFCWAKIWHDNVNDRLLALIIESIRPIDQDKAHVILESYEIIQAYP